MSQPTFEPIGPLRVNVPGVNATGVTVDGAPETIAMDIPTRLSSTSESRSGKRSLAAVAVAVADA